MQRCWVSGVNIPVLVGLASHKTICRFVDLEGWAAFYGQEKAVSFTWRNRSYSSLD